MKTVTIQITSCQECPYFSRSPYPTNDSFERPNYWWCSNPKVEEVPSEFEGEEEDRIFIKKDENKEKLRKIAGYVEWHEEDKIKIPDWCPL